MTLLGGLSQAALVARDGGMVYDTVLNITWLADLNQARASGYDDDGLMTWAAARQWADDLVYGGFDDWRLPTLNAADSSCSNTFDPGPGFPLQHYGHGCSQGELSHLFVVDLGDRAQQSVLDTTGDSAEQIANLALFQQVQTTGYWSGTPSVPSPDKAWWFRTAEGRQDFTSQGGRLYAVAVRAGDVATSVPEPSGLALIALGTALALRRRRPG